MSNLRNAKLLQQVARHPLKAALARCFDIAETFQGDVEFLQLNDGLSPQGRQNAMQSKLRAAVRDLRDARAAIADLAEKLDKKRKAVAMPKFDPADIRGFLARQELRSALRAAANTGQRALMLQDPAFADACLEQPAALSGLHVVEGQPGEDASLLETTKKQRLETLFGPQLEEIDALEGTIAEANMIADLARNDLKLHSEMDDRTFIEFIRPVEAKQNAVWLRKYMENGVEVIRVVDLENHRARVATEREILDGKYYENFDEYQKDRSAA
jgi:hypothetical protein